MDMDEKNRIVDQALADKGLTRVDLDEDQLNQIARALSLTTEEQAIIGFESLAKPHRKPGDLIKKVDQFLAERNYH